MALYIHQNVQFELREDLICEELESVTVQIKNGKFKPFLVTSIYGPPGNQSVVSVSLSLCLVGWNHKIKNLLSWVI